MSDKDGDRPSSGRHDPMGFSDLRTALSHVLADELPHEEEDGAEELLHFIEDLPRSRPREIFAELEELGYVGQDAARRAMSLMAYRHVQRLRYLYLDRVSLRELPPKSNYLLIGPTGSGKTHLTELVFRHILQLPTVLVDITTYSETGYVGQDVTSILTRLLYAAEGSKMLAEIGVICLDEFDKIASSQNNAVFAGAGTTKDISGLGVQRELLKLLEEAEITVPTEFSHSSYQQHVLMSTANIPFLACGAFSGFKFITDLYDEVPRMGFLNAEKRKPNQEIAVSLRQDEVDQTRHFQQYGFLPELIARFERVVPFRALDGDTLRLILERNMLAGYRREFALAGIELMVEESLIGRLIERALKRETGARGLRSSLAYVLEEAAFDIYSSDEVETARLSWSKDDGLTVALD